MSKVNFNPIGSRILVKPDSTENTTASGIIIPEIAKQQPQTGTVVAVGPGTHDNPMTINVGNRIIHGKQAGVEVNIEKQTYVLMNETDAYGVI